MGKIIRAMKTVPFIAAEGERGYLVPATGRGILPGTLLAVFTGGYVAVDEGDEGIQVLAETPINSVAEAQAALT